MHTRPIPVFLNPAAGRGKARGYAASIMQILRSNGVRGELTESTAPGDIERLASSAASANAERVIVAGGDGSVHEASMASWARTRQPHSASNCVNGLLPCCEGAQASGNLKPAVAR